MDSVYASPGESVQQIGGECPEGWVGMRQGRPTLDHVANVLGEWVLPPPAVPESVTKYQCCVALTRHGLLALTSAFFDAMPADDPRRLAWFMAATVQRHSESTLAAAAHLRLTETDVDKLFIEAAQVE